MTNTSFTTADLQRKSGEITDAIAAGNAVTLTRYRKPFAVIIPAAKTAAAAPALPAELAEALDAYAATRDMSADEAMRALLSEKLLSVPTTMWAIVPEAETVEDLELVISEYREEGEGVEYEYDGREFCLSYAKLRKWWFVQRDDKGADGEWTRTYTICKNKAAARKLYRETIIAESAAWDPASGAESMWWDAWDVTFTEFRALGKKSPIPLAAFGADVDED